MKSRFWLAGGVVLMLAACGGGEEKKDLIQLSHTDEKKAVGSIPGGDRIASVNGHLVFKDQAHFDATARSLFSQSAAQRDQWLRSFPNFKPLVVVYKDLMAQGDNQLEKVEGSVSARGASMDAVLEETNSFMKNLAAQNGGAVHFALLENKKLLQRNIQDDSLAYLLNGRGIVQIGNVYYRYTNDNTRSVIDSKSASLQRGLIELDPVCDLKGHCETSVSQAPKVPICDPDGNCETPPDNNSGGGGSHSSSVPTLTEGGIVAEGEMMNFRVEVSPHAALYPFTFLKSAGVTADRGDIGLITFSNDVRLTADGNFLNVPADTGHFTIGIQIRSDGYPEPQEVVTLAIGESSIARGIILPSEATSPRQNYEHSSFASQGHKPAHGILLYEKMVQGGTGNEVGATYSMRIVSLKSCDWCPYWSSQDANLKLAGYIEFERDGWTQSKSFYQDWNWESEVGHMVFNETGTINGQLSSVPRIKKSRISASRSGGDSGVTTYTQHDEW